MQKYIELLKAQLELLKHIKSVSIENDVELHFIAFNENIVMKVNPDNNTYIYNSGGNTEKRAAIDEALRNL